MRSIPSPKTPDARQLGENVASQTGSDRLLLSLLIMVALAVRLDFMRAVQFAIDGDEAIVGLMGRHILEGKGVPVFYYGQHYMGSLEAIMASCSFLLFGSTPFALQLVPLVWSVALVPLVYVIGRSLKSRWAGLVAAALTALPPPALIVWSSKARGGFIEIVVLGTLALYLTMVWLRDASSRARYPAAVGFVLGVGWWVNNQIAYAMAAIGLIAFLHFVVTPALDFASGRGTVRSLRTLGSVASVGVLAFFLGGSPYWIYNIRLGFPSAGMFGLSKYEVFREHLDGLRYIALPMLLGAKRFWQKNWAFWGAREFVWALYVLPIVGVCIARWRQWLRLVTGRVDRREPIELFVIFCVSCCTIFALSSYGWLVQAPRYLLPLYPAVFILLGVAAQYLRDVSPATSAVFVGSLLLFNGVAAYYPERATAGEPVVFAGQRVERDHAPLIAALDAHGITRVRTNYWIGYRLAFETGERITFSMLAEPDQVRIPEYEEKTFENSALPLVLVESEASIVRPALRKLGYSFAEQRAGGYFLLYDLHASLSEVTPLSNDSFVDVKASSGRSPRAALDGDVRTRWGTETHQAPGQEFSVSLSKPVPVSEIQYDLGSWRNDLAKSLTIYGELADGSMQQLLSAAEFKGVRYLGWGERRLTVRFSPITIKRILLVQGGADPVVDWSIAELRLYGP